MVMLLFTDGLSNREEHLTRQMAKELKETGIEMFTVSLTKDIDEEELRLIASSSQHVIVAPDILVDQQGWHEAVNKTVNGICDSEYQHDQEREWGYGSRERGHLLLGSMPL